MQLIAASFRGKAPTALLGSNSCLIAFRIICQVSSPLQASLSPSLVLQSCKHVFEQLVNLKTELCIHSVMWCRVKADHLQSDTLIPRTGRNFASSEDVLTVEIEHVDAKAMMDVREGAKIDVEPTPETLDIIQDKFKQKEHFNHNAGIKVTSYIDISGEGTGDLAVMVLGVPFMLKSKRSALVFIQYGPSTSLQNANKIYPKPNTDILREDKRDICHKKATNVPAHPIHMSIQVGIRW